MIVFSGPILLQRRQEREEAERRRREEEHQRYLERERQRLERNRGRRLMELARRWEELKIARAFLVELEKLPQPNEYLIDDRSPQEWLAWARAWLEAADPLIQGPMTIYTELAKVKSWTYND